MSIEDQRPRKTTRRYVVKFSTNRNLEVLASSLVHGKGGNTQAPGCLGCTSWCCPIVP